MASRSAKIRLGSRPRAAGLPTTTRSPPCSPCWRWRNHSRIRRRRRLRSTARLSTLRETARPSRGMVIPAARSLASCSRKLRLKAVPAARLPSAKQRLKSAPARTCAAGRKRRSEATGVGIPLLPDIAAMPVLTGGSGGQALAALGAARIDDLAATGGLHPGAEPVGAGALEEAGLERALHGDTKGWDNGTGNCTDAEGFPSISGLTAIRMAGPLPRHASRIASRAGLMFRASSPRRAPVA